MKMTKKLFLWIIPAIMILLLITPQAAFAQEGGGEETPAAEGTTETEETPVQDETVTPEPTATEIPPATETPVPTNTTYSRPLITVSSYSTSPDPVTPGASFEIKIFLYNSGAQPAQNIVVNFNGSDFLPLSSGGIQAISSLQSGKTTEVVQTMRTNESLWGYGVGSLGISISYTDQYGTGYTESFNMTLNLTAPNASTWATATPTSSPRPQLVIQTYQSDTNPLQPGSSFNLSMEVLNLGSGDAKAVTMVLGGGVTLNTSTDGTSTSNSGGFSTVDSDLKTFAPLDSSNLIYLGDINRGVSVASSNRLIVNVATEPGVYPFKISFVYLNNEGKQMVDNQVITILIHRLPNVEVGFYRDPGILFTDQPNILPLQITNMGKNTVVLGNLNVTAADSEFSQNMAQIGSLEPGGYFTLDTTVIPMLSGQMDLQISIAYTDDFNQPQVINKTLSLTVEAIPTPEPMIGMEGSPYGDEMFTPAQTEETFGQKILRFFKGLLGLGSEAPQNDSLQIMPVEPGEEMEFYAEPKG